MTQEKQLDFESFIDVMVQIYKLTSDKIGYSKLVKNKDRVEGTSSIMNLSSFILSRMEMAEQEDSGSR